jgi:hypothetical protein
MGGAKRRREGAGDDEYYRGRKRMEVKLALLADAVNESREGKLNITGEFDVISAVSAPVRWPVMSFVVRVECSISEGSRHTARFGLFDEDGGVVIPYSPELQMRFGSRGPGRPLRGQIIGQLEGAVFARFGDYELKVQFDGGKEEAVIPLIVRHLPVSQVPPGHGEGR